jgi:integrase
VKRRVLMPGEVNALAANLHEPYSTLVLFLAATGLRIGEAIAVKWSDIEGSVLQVARRIYEGDEDTVKSDRSVRQLPIESSLQARMRQLGGKEFISSSRRVGNATDRG